MTEDFVSILTRFHRDIERIVDSRIAPFRDEVLTNFDGLALEAQL